MKLTRPLLMLALLYTSSAFADTNAWLFRLRAVGVLPQITSNDINFVGGKVNEASNEIVPEFDISYFFTPYFTAEAIFGTVRHSVAANHTVIGHADLGKVSLLPFTVTLQYRFLPDRVINPYLGLGINFTHFYNIKNGPIATATSYSNSFGPSLNAGVDISIDSNWSINADVKKMYIQTNAYVNTAVGQLNPTVRLNPWVVGVGIGYTWC